MGKGKACADISVECSSVGLRTSSGEGFEELDTLTDCRLTESADEARAPATVIGPAEMPSPCDCSPTTC